MTRRRIITFGVVGIALFLVFWFLYKRKKDDENEVKRLEDAPPAVGPPVITPVSSVATQSVVYDPETGEGRNAIVARAKALFNSASAPGIRNNAGITEKLFAGVQYPNGMKAVLRDVVPDGNPFNFPIVPDWLNPAYKQRMDSVTSTEGFEKLTKTNGIEFATTSWRGTLSMPEFGVVLWPASMKNHIESGLFGTVGAADKDRSERYDAFTTDVKTMAGNLKKLSDDVGRAFEAQALQDLRASGWKFLGFDQA